MSDSIQSRLNSLLKQGQLCDVVFVVGAERKEFKAHKLVLAAVSEVFKLMFYGMMAKAAENANETKPKAIEIPDVYPEAFDILLKFAYQNEAAVHFASMEMALRCVYAANKYMVKPLTDLSIRYLDNKIDADNSCHVYQMALMINNESLSNECFKFIVKNSSKSLLTEGFTLLSSDVVKSLVENCSSKVEAKTIYEALLNWGQRRIDNNAGNVTTRHLLEPFFPYIRFLSMSAPDFFTVVAPSGILTDEEIVSISLVLYGNDLKSRQLPEWLNASAEIEVARGAQRKRNVAHGTGSGTRLAKKYATNYQLRNRKSSK